MPRNALPQNYMDKQPVLLEDFSDITSWTAPTNATIVEDLVNVYTGTKSVKLSTTSATAVNGTVDKTINVNFSNTSRRIYVKFFLHTAQTTINAIYFYFGSIAWTKYFYASITSSKIQPGWNYFVITPDMCTYVGGETWDSTMTKARMAVNPATGQTATVSFDGIYYDGVGKPKILITFDDGWNTLYSNAFSYMQQKGLNGTLYLIPNWVNGVSPSPYNMTKAQVDELHNAGWCIANHTMNHAFYTTENYTVADYKDKVKQCIDWLMANGYTRGAYHIAYPRGEYDSAVIQAMKELGMKTGRTVHTTQQHTFIIDDPFQLNIMAMSSTVDLATAKSYVDTAISTGTTCILMFHQIPVNDTANTTDAQPSIAFSQSKFQGLIDYIAERKVDVATIDEWCEGLTNPRRKVV